MPTIDLRFTVINQPVPNFIHDAIAPFTAASNHYFHQPDELRSLLAKRHNVELDMVSLVAGIDQAILVLCSLRGQNTHVFTPTYISYSDAKRIHGQLHEHWSLIGSRYEIDTSERPSASLIFLANPNNPAGITPKAEIVKLVRNNPQALVVVDEAYGDFHTESLIDEVAAHDNLLVSRSFSKGFALAGFRIGYLIGQPKLLESLYLESTWFNTAYPSVGAAIAALGQEAPYAAMRTDLISRREDTQDYLKTLDFNVIDSKINAVLIEFPDATQATKFAEHLASYDILVNQGNGASNIGLGSQHVRFSIGAPLEMKRLHEAAAGFQPTG